MSKKTLGRRRGWQIEGLPATVRRAGPQAAERTVEFFTAQIRNPHTRAAYAAAVTRFFTWCDARGLELADGQADRGGIMESWWDLDERSWHSGSKLGTSTSVRTATWA